MWLLGLGMFGKQLIQGLLSKQFLMIKVLTPQVQLQLIHLIRKSFGWEQVKM